MGKRSSRSGVIPKSKTGKILYLLLIVLLVLYIINVAFKAFFYVALGIAAIVFALAAWKIYTQPEAQAAVQDTVDKAKAIATDPPAVSISFGN
jgi:hypothetical protein